MDNYKNTEQKADIDSRLVPIMREGVEVIKMIFFKKLKHHFLQNQQGQDAVISGRLAAVIINSLFGTPNHSEPFASFASNEKVRVESELQNIGQNFEEMRRPLTDALRVQFLCDSLDGIDSSAILLQAEELGVLLPDREVPLPKSFLNLVRRLGSSFNILTSENIPG